MPTPNQAASSFGVPEISLPNAPTVFGKQGVNFFQAQALENNSRSSLLKTMEFRDKVSTLGKREMSRIDGAAAMRDISQLDPSAPDYLDRRNEIMTNNPNAVLDDTASRFMGLQEDVYKKAQGDRDEDDAFTKQTQRDALRDAAFNKRDDTRQEKADNRSNKKKFEDEVDKLDEFGADRMSDHIAEGMKEEDALRQAKRDVKQNADIDQMIASGQFTDQEIFGARGADGALLVDTKTGEVSEPGLINDKGELDTRRMASKLGHRNRMDTAKKQKDYELKKHHKNLELLTEELDNADVNGLSKDEMKALRQQMHNIKEQIGLVPKDPTGNSQPVGMDPRTGQVPNGPQPTAPTARPVDRFRPTS